MKDILGLLAIVLPACFIIFAVWLNSPMYEEVLREQRLAAQLYLVGTYSYDLTTRQPFLRENLIEHYGFKDEEINSGKIMERFIETQDTANKTEVYQPSPTIDGYLRTLFREVWSESANN